MAARLEVRIEPVNYSFVFFSAFKS